jgi:hypothetical protein
MLIDVVELAEIPKRIVPFLVRIQTLDDSHRLIAGSVYLSANRGFVILGFNEAALKIGKEVVPILG